MTAIATTSRTLLLFCMMSAIASETTPLRSLTPPVLLPDGSEFKTWESGRPLEFSKTYYVDCRSLAASDENPGTEELPFASINRAAQVLETGQRVIVKAGIYRESVTPLRGGDSPEKMISYEAEPGAVIRGSMVFHPQWEAEDSGGGAAVWRASVGKDVFAGYNPFRVSNVVVFKDWMEQHKGKAPFTLARGMVFQNGRHLRQVATREDLQSGEGAFWVDRENDAVFVRTYGDLPPGDQEFEVTDRETLFAPPSLFCSKCNQLHPTAGLGFIRVKGFIFEHAAGPWPLYQLGAVSTGAGHHWIIEENTIRWANGIGVDLGTLHGHQPEKIRQTVGHHIARRNTVTDCGISGISGLGAKDSRDFGLLIEDNVLVRNSFHDVEATLQESAAIKTHVNRRCLIRRNFIAQTHGGPGIWMDWNNGDSRCTQNVILSTRSSHGAIFCEFSADPNLIDRNVIWDSDGNGIYEHDTRGNIFSHNFIGRSTESAFFLKGKISERQLEGRDPLVAGDQVVVNNLLFANAQPNKILGAPSRVEGNSESGSADLQVDETVELELSLAGPVISVTPLDLVSRDFYGKPFPEGAVAPGPFAKTSTIPARFQIWPICSKSPHLPK